MTVAPQTDTRYVILTPGKPVRILENKSVECRMLGDTGAVVTQDIGGWIAMPPEHWNALRRKLKQESGK